MPVPFRDRRDAGQQLAAHLDQYRDRPDTIVLGLPRGGMPVAAEVASALHAPLDALLVRKLGVPGHEELAMGAITSGGLRVLNEETVRDLGIPRETIDAVEASERRELARRERLYRGAQAPPDVAAKTVILVDDGLATGSTMRAAALALRMGRPVWLVGAVPVASRIVCDAMRDVVDDMVCAETPEPFFAVGLWYEDFGQTSDDEVRRQLTLGQERMAGVVPRAAASHPRIRPAPPPEEIARAAPPLRDDRHLDSLLDQIAGADWPDTYRVNRFDRREGVEPMAVVLAPIDGSDLSLRAVPWAAQLAGPRGTVVLLRVVPGMSDETRDEATAEAKAEFDAAAATIADAGITIEHMVSGGEPDASIVAAAGQRGADFITIASHGRGAIGRAIFGSVADHVSRTATVPVLIVRAETEAASRAPDVRRIVVPLDGSPLAERALPVATVLAKQFGVLISVIRAIDAATVLPVAPSYFDAAPIATAEITDQIWQEAEAEAKATVANAVAQLQRDGVEASGALLNGSPFFAISDSLQPGDLLVLTSHGHGGVQRWLLGSLAEKLVREAPAPVLLVPATERTRAVEESQSREAAP